MKKFLQLIALLWVASLGFGQNGQVLTIPTQSSGGASPAGNPGDYQYNLDGSNLGAVPDGSSNTVLHGGKSFSPISQSDVDSTIALTNQIPVIDTPPGTSQFSSGGRAVYLSGLSYAVVPSSYMIGGNSYSFVSPVIVTLPAADVTNDRIDLIVVNDAGTATYIEGTPAPNPIAPSVDPGTQLYVTFAYIAANAITPSNITQMNLYLENTEWTCSASANFNCASISLPFAGSKDIQATNAVAGNTVTLTKPSSTDQLSNYNQLIFEIRSTATWVAAKAISLYWVNGTTVVGKAVALKTGLYGFSSTNTTNYQLIAIPATAFGAGSNNISALIMKVTGSGAAIGFHVDNVILQGGVSGATVVQPNVLNKSRWNPTVTYNPNDEVIFQGGAFICLVANVNSYPTPTNTNWVAAGGWYQEGAESNFNTGIPEQYLNLIDDANSRLEWNCVDDPGDATFPGSTDCQGTIVGVVFGVSGGTGGILVDNTDSENPVVNMRTDVTERSCDIVVGKENGSALTNTDFSNLDQRCFMSTPFTILEIWVDADAGTPTVMPGYSFVGSSGLGGLLSGNLSTGASGAAACTSLAGGSSLVATQGSPPTCSATLNSVGGGHMPSSGGTWFGILSGTAGGVAKRISVHIIYSVP